MEFLTAFAYVMVGVVAGFALGHLWTKYYCCKPHMEYSEFKEIFRNSKSSTAVVTSLSKMFAGEIPYPRWNDILRVYGHTKEEDIYPIEFLALWVFAEKYKKEKYILRKYPNCKETAEKIKRGETINKT
mgnify:CR=1 FL=1